MPETLLGLRERSQNAVTVSTGSPEMGFTHPTGMTNSVAWPLAKLVMYYPFSLTQSMSVVRMGWGNGSTVDAAGLVQVGVYNEAFALLGSTASTTPSGASVPQIATPTAFSLPAGRRLYLAITCDSVTQTFLSSTAPAAGTCAGYGIMSETTSVFGLTNPGVPTVPTNEVMTWVMISSATTV